MNPLNAAKAIYRMAGAADEVVPAIKSGASSAKKAISEMADDWGWKGGKPGEITGLGILDSAKNAETWAKNGPQVISQMSRFVEKYPNSPLSASISGTVAPRNAAREFGYVMKDLQMSDVPRVLTGRIASMLTPKDLSNSLGTLSIANRLADELRTLTPQQQDTFISLYPEWVGSIEDLAAAARSL